MPDTTLHQFLAESTQKAADEITAAFLRLPEEKRDWTPEGTSRSALDQIAECALLNGYTVDMLRTRAFPFRGSGFAEYLREKEEAKAQGWEHIRTLLQENTRRLIDALREVPEEAFSAEVALPSRMLKMTEAMAYPYWNMTYHMGQINYIASMLDCLK